MLEIINTMIMKIISNVMINVFFSALWSLAFVILAYFLLFDYLTETSFFFVLIGWFLGSLTLGFVHVLIYLPTMLYYSKFVQEVAISESYQRIFPVLLIPLAAYLYISMLLNSNLEFIEEGIQTSLVLGIGLMLVHSISLHSLLTRLKNTKKDNDEKNSELSI